MTAPYSIDKLAVRPEAAAIPGRGSLVDLKGVLANEAYARNFLPLGLAAIAITLAVTVGQLDRLPLPLDETTRDAMKFALFGVAFILTGLSGTVLSVNAMGGWGSEVSGWDDIAVQPSSLVDLTANPIQPEQS